MRATVGKITTCFYEVENGETRYAVNIKTRDTGRIKNWAAIQVCFKRSDAIRLGREDEWLKLNAHMMEGA